MHQRVVCKHSIGPYIGDRCYEQAAFLNRLCYHLSSAVLLHTESGAHLTGSTCVFFLNSTAFYHHGQTAGSGVSKCGAAVLSPNQGGVSLQPEPWSSVEQQWLDWDFRGTFSHVTNIILCEHRDTQICFHKLLSRHRWALPQSDSIIRTRGRLFQKATLRTPVSTAL